MCCILKPKKEKPHDYFPGWEGLCSCRKKGYEGDQKKSYQEALFRSVLISSPPIKQTSQKRWLELLLKAATRLSLLAVYNHGPDPRGDSGLKAGAVAGPKISLVVVVVVVVPCYCCYVCGYNCNLQSNCQIPQVTQGANCLIRIFLPITWLVLTIWHFPFP